MGSRRRWYLMLAVLLSVCPTVRLSAQIGHDPNHSPYHDIQRGGDVRFSVGPK